MNRPTALLTWLLCGAVAGWAAPLQRELGERLLYHRAVDLPADLPPAPKGRKQPIVLDLRYAQGDEAAAIATQAWLKFYASARTPVFVLANADTSGELRRVLAALRRAPGIVIVGRASRSLEPDVPIKTTADAERQAYDALAAGAPVAALVIDHPDKVRNDEASLSRDRLAEAAADSVEETKSKPPPPIDVALQRAVHLHRALVALRKI